MADFLPVYNWPETRFVHENTPGQQIDHILSEVDEVIEAGPESNERIEEELADLHHSLETFWRMLEESKGQDYVQALFARTKAKNAERGYYTGRD